MLQLKNIVKDYVSGDTVTHALKGLSINFRRNEFVAILGASGCGKTTLLNITGGLDRYTSGDLLIEGKSTKDFKDQDWDTYRNHSIGFVFQTYNLISHQNIHKNVELALTISGVSKAERKQRAEKVLELVGLGGLGKKKPNQLSGGQMQRVAIARALVNNPEIVLADEPTGALDSETSVQIMDLLKEVAKDRLVIMVTHNPELAEKYATRIISMKDGQVLNDNNPYVGETEKERNKAHESKKVETKGKKEKSSMSFWTAATLSLANLRSKMKRTVLVTIAGSIGIIGVSAVLAVSQGVTDYVGNMQDDMLSSYPLKLAEESVDLTSLISGMDASTAKEAFHFDPANPKVGIDSMLSYLMTTYSDVTSVKTNVIDKKLMDYIDHAPQDALYSTYKNYGIDPTNSLFTDWVSDPRQQGKPDVHTTISINGLTQRYIAELKTVKGFSQYASYVNLFTDFMKEVPGDKDYILSQYDMLGNSSYSNARDEVALVVDKNTTLTDLLLGQLGFIEHDEFINIAHQAMDIANLPKDMSKEDREAEIEKIKQKYPYRREFAYEDLIGKELIYIPENKLYQNGVVADDSEVANLYILQTTPDLSIFTLSYNPDNDTLGGTHIYIDGGMKYESVNFIRVGDKPASVTKLEDYIDGAFKAYKNGDPKDDLLYTINLTELTSIGMVQIFKGNDTTPTVGFGQRETVKTQIAGYNYQAELSEDMKNYPENYGGFKLKISSILRLKESKNFGCLNRGVYYSKAFANKFIEDSNKPDNEVVNSFKKYIGSKEEKTSQFNAYVKFNYFDYTDDQHPAQKSGYATALNGDLSTSFSDLFSSLTGVNYYESDKVHLRSLCGLKVVEIADEQKQIVGYDFDLIPSSISFYPKSFADKDKVTDYLDKWNNDGDIVLSTGEVLKKADRSEITYTDTVKLIITVINTLITVVTVALVAFTSLALVVSCFMIAVITYISVVERTKEIGIIRSVGGRKKDVSRLFITETFMTGALSGLFGLAITYIFEIVFNIAIGAAFKVYGIANLTIVTALIMLLISILLSVLSGLIPSMKASHQDPVVALRSGE